MALPWTAGWWEFFRLNQDRGPNPESLYNIVSHFSGWPGFDGDLPPNQPPVVLNAVSAAAFAACLVAITVLALRSPRPPRLAPLCFLVVASFLLVNKVWSPQYSLWLVPLAVLAVPHRRLLLGWMIVDALVWPATMLSYLGTDKKGLPTDWFLGTVLVRDAVVVALCVLVVRTVLAPGRDLVRATAGDDPDWPLTPAQSGARAGEASAGPGSAGRAASGEPAPSDCGVGRGHEAIASRPTVSRRRTPSSSTYGPTRYASSPAANRVPLRGGFSISPVPARRIAITRVRADSSCIAIPSRPPPGATVRRPTRKASRPTWKVPSTPRPSAAPTNHGATSASVDRT